MTGVEEEGRETMAKQFACKDIGMNCGFKTEANNEEELMVKIAQHAKEVHNMSQISPDLLQKVKGAIKEKRRWF
jgi:predicted small metal-binding protein